jgi:outer membrane immunogenic protein
MKKLLLSSVTLLGFTAGALAADLPARTVAPAPVAVTQAFTWTGFHVGVNGGYSWNNAEFRGRATSPDFGDFFPVPPGFETLDSILFDVNGGYLPRRIGIESNGAVFGAQAGATYQFGMFVVGTESDISWMDTGKASRYTSPDIDVGFFDGNVVTRAQSNIEWLATSRLRAGLAFDRFMVYGTGGLAYGEVTNNVRVSAVPAGGPSPALVTFEGRESDTELGYAVGGGVEYAFANNISLKGEYLYYNLGKQDVNLLNIPITVPGAGITPIAVNYKVENDGHIFRAGLNYRFSGF